MKTTQTLKASFILLLTFFFHFTSAQVIISAPPSPSPSVTPGGLQVLPSRIPNPGPASVSGDAWLLLGNTGTSETVNFLGTTDSQNLVFKVNNNVVGQFFKNTGPNSDAIFLGRSVGNNVTNAPGSTFIGANAGNGALNATNSNFLGISAGLGAINAFTSNFIGHNAGSNATEASSANFFGHDAGSNAVNASNSIFIGTTAGVGATNAATSVFIGTNSGVNAANAANSIFIGQNAGGGDQVNNFQSGTSILLGNNTSTGGFSNSIALGEGATNTASNQLMLGSTTSPIDSLVITQSGGTSCIIDATGLSCSSDETLKTNITQLPNVLDNLKQVKTVTYDWKNKNKKGEQEKRSIGFIAQNLQQYFPEVVGKNDDHLVVNYEAMAPVLAKGIQELDEKINTTNQKNSQQVTTGKVQAKMMCLEDICITKEQLKKLLKDSDNL